MQIIPAQTLRGRVARVLAAGPADFVTEARPALELTYEGVPGDKHAGLLRRSGPREPWYPRGTQMRNERQLSLLSVEELAEVAADLSVPEVKPEWIGGNLVVEGVPHFSWLPPRTLMMFENGVTIRIDGDNGPCRISGRSIVKHYPERPDIEFGFIKAAKRKRGLLGWVERAGTITPGETIKIRIWEQVIYPQAQGQLL